MIASSTLRLRTGVIVFAVLALALAIADLVHPLPVWGAVFVGVAAVAMVAFSFAHPPRVAPAGGTATAPAGTPGLADLLRQGLRMGMTAFGGAMAVVAQIDRELVARLGWVSPEAFTEAAAFGQSLPGAIANNTLALLGFRLGGWQGAGLLVGGYVLPSFLLMLVFGLAYGWLRGLAVTDAALGGLSPAVVAVVAVVALGLWRRMVAPRDAETWPAALWRRRVAIAVGLVVVAAVAWLGIGAPGVILVCGFATLAGAFASGRLAALLPIALPVLPAAAGATRPDALVEVVTVFLSTGATTFGGGYVMVPVLEHSLVHAGWIGAREFMDAVALGQITPGPVVITASFVGYRLAGLAGALFGTVAVFAPSFLMSMAVGGSIERVRRHPAMRAFLAGLEPAIVGVMTAAVVALARSGIRSGAGVVLAVAGFALLLTRRVGVAPALIGSAALGVALRFAGLPL